MDHVHVLLVHRVVVLPVQVAEGVEARHHQEVARYLRRVDAFTGLEQCQYAVDLIRVLRTDRDETRTRFEPLITTSGSRYGPFHDAPNSNQPALRVPGA
jgi:hypothetical protein